MRGLVILRLHSPFFDDFSALTMTAKVLTRFEKV